MIDRQEAMDELAEDEALLADGFEEALVGVCYRFGQQSLALYDFDKCVAILVERDGMTMHEAWEYLHFNTLGAWMGPGTPAFCRLFERDTLEDTSQQGDANG